MKCGIIFMKSKTPITINKWLIQTGLSYMWTRFVPTGTEKRI